MSSFYRLILTGFSRYGLPIDMASYISSSMFEGPDADVERAVVKAVMQDVQAQLLKMTINAPDWYALSW